jgi:transglutaminase-like putative cysteine protease
VKLSICHVTEYTYSAPIVHGLQRLRVRPKPTHWQKVLSWDMELDGACHELEYDDHNYNHVSLVSLEPGATTIRIACHGEVEIDDNSGVIGKHAGHMPLWCFLRPTELTRPGPKLRALVAGLDAKPEDEGIAALHALSSAVLDAVTYETGRTEVSTTAEDALVAGHGVCQDHAHIFIGAARLLGVPARYVSGYLMMDDRVEQEAGHGWAEAWMDGLGWVGFDVSNGISPDARYVRVATGCDYREAAPMTGVAMGAGESVLNVQLAVEQQQADQ